MTQVPRIVQFNVLRAPTGATGVQLRRESDPLLPGTTQRVMTTIQRLGALAHGTPQGRLARVSLATDDTAFLAARVESRINLRQAEGVPITKRLVAATSRSLAADPAGAEYLPRSGEVLLGPEFSRVILGIERAPTADRATRLAYEAAHEIAHARQPASTRAMQSAALVRREEARADTVARHAGLADAVAAVLGLGSIRHDLLRRDSTYSDVRGELGLRLATRGRRLEDVTTARWLDSTPVERI